MDLVDPVGRNDYPGKTYGLSPTRTNHFDAVANCKLSDIEDQLSGLSGNNSFRDWKNKIVQFYRSNSNHNVQNIGCADALHYYWDTGLPPDHLPSCRAAQSQRHSSCGGGIVIKPVVSDFIPFCGGVR